MADGFFDAADSPVATVDNMARIAPNDWPRLVFVLHAFGAAVESRMERADPVEGRRQGRAIAPARKDALSCRLGHVASGTA